jgi:hypothetical protein
MFVHQQPNNAPGIPWKPGQSGNKRGRPSYRNFRDLLNAKLRKRWTQFANGLLDLAINGKDEETRLRASTLVLRYLNRDPAGYVKAAKPESESIEIVEEAKDASR